MLSHGTSPRPHKLFLLGFETATWHVLGRPQKPQKPPQQLSKAFKNVATPPQQLSKACRLLGHGTSLGPTSCFYWASKLLCGTFWASLESLKTSAAAFEGLRNLTTLRSTFRRRAACLGHGTSLGLTSCFLLGFETAMSAMWHVLGKALKSLKTSAAAFRRPWNLTTLRSSFRRRCRLLGHGNLPRPHELFSLGLRNC